MEPRVDYIPQDPHEGTAPTLVIDGLVVVVRQEGGRLELYVDTEWAGPSWGPSEDSTPVDLYINSSDPVSTHR